MFSGVIRAAFKGGVIYNLCGARSRGCTKLKYPYFHNWRFASSKHSSSVTPLSEATSIKPVLKEGFVQIYRLPPMSTVASLCRARVLGTAFCLISTPLAVALTFAGLIPSDYCLFACVVAGGVFLKLYILGILCSKTVGFLYCSPDMSTVKIAYIDDLGRRKEDIFATSDLIPFSELPSSPSDVLYSKIRRYSESSKVYKLNLSHGQITDRDRFCCIFGKVD